MLTSVTQCQDGCPQRDDVAAVRVVGVDRRQLQRQQLQFTDQPQSPLRSGPPPSPGDVLVPRLHCRDLHRAATDAWFGAIELAVVGTGRLGVITGR